MAFSILYWSNYTAGTAKLMRKSETAVQSEHVLKFVYDRDAQFIRGIVQASMRDRSYQVTITLGSNYTVEQSTCECVNGMDKCHHKASILLYGYKNLSKTDVRQSWIKHPKSAPPRQTKTMEDLFPAPDRFINYRAIDRPVDGNDRDFLYQKLRQSGRFSAMHWILAPEPPVPQVCVPVIDDLLANQEFLAAEHPMTWLRQKLIVNDQQIQQIAALTVGQKDNCLWSTVRKNRLTASNFGCVLAAVRRNRYPASLFKRLCQAYDLSKKDAIIWGVCNERVAIDKYRSYGDAVVEPTGIWLHSNGVLGCSPDGIVRRPAAFGFHHQSPPLIHIMQACNIRPTVLEVKCPYTAKEKTISEAIDTIDDFCLEFQEFCGERTYKLKETHPYYDQIQGQLFITGKQACDFMVWTPKDCAIVRITQDPVWQTNISVLTDFYFHRFIPHLQQ